MFGMDPKALNAGLTQLTKMVDAQEHMANQVEQLNKLLPELISELKKFNDAHSRNYSGN